MTCSSNTTCSTDGARAGRAPAWRSVLAGGAAALLTLAWPAHSAQPAAAQLLDRARAALDRGDGIDAEMKLRAALAAGAGADNVRAWMGQAYLAQNEPDKARQWLESGAFSADSALAGWRALGRLAMRSNDLPGARRAYGRALALAPRDARLWVEIGQMRERGGDYGLAVEAADHALAIDRHDVRALDFKGLTERRRTGLRAALPWFASALERDPDDVPTLLDRAATLGDLGRAGECIALTRRVLALDPGNARAYYLQAVVAARAGRYALARRLLARTGGKLDDRPGVRLLAGILELAAGNPSTAAEAFEAVLRERPDNRRARDLLARAIYKAGEYRYATLRFAGDIAKGTASPYLLTVVARAHEALGERARAGELLDRAAVVPALSIRVLAGEPRVGALLAAGDGAGADAVARSALSENPGSFAALARAGDVALARGEPAAAAAYYEDAARLNYSESLFRRRLAAFAMAGDRPGAERLVRQFLVQNPANRAAIEAAGQIDLARGDFARAQARLEWLRETGSARSVGVLAGLAVSQWRAGEDGPARRTALALYRLQRANPVARQAMALGHARAAAPSLVREPAPE